MDSSQSTPSRYCPQCGAELLPGQSTCWLCLDKSSSHGAAESAAGRAGLGPSGPATSSDLGLSSLLLLITFFVILGGIFVMNPGLGIVTAIPAVPALLRTSFVAVRRTASGNPMSAGGKVAIFLLSMVMCVIVILAAGATFFFTCLATGGPNDSSFGMALLLGGAAGVAVGIALTWLFWNISRGNRNG